MASAGTGAGGRSSPAQTPARGGACPSGPHSSAEPAHPSSLHGQNLSEINGIVMSKK